jgi:hypothetical protein
MSSATARRGGGRLKGSKGEVMSRPCGAGVALTTLLACGAGLALPGELLPGEAQAGGSKGKAGLKITSTVGKQLTEAEKSRVLAVIVAHTKANPKKVRLLGARLTRGDRDAPQNGVAAVVLDYDTHKATRYVVDSTTGKVLQQRQLSGQPLPATAEKDEARQIIRKDPKLAPLLKDGDLVGGFLVSHHHATTEDSKNRLLQFQLLKKSDHNQLLRAIIVDMTARKVTKSIAPPK